MGEVPGALHRRRLVWPLVTGVVVLASSFALIVINYMGFWAFRNWVLFVGLGLNFLGWVTLVVGLVLFVVGTRRPPR